jgi:hypothetical protein
MMTDGHPSAHDTGPNRMQATSGRAAQRVPTGRLEFQLTVSDSGSDQEQAASRNSGAKPCVFFCATNTPFSHQFYFGSLSVILGAAHPLLPC